ncbi:MAG: methylmalonyl Co-A mutase-associated GTPase MeaB [Desulfatitalea sp.]|nr:methylmalonyl Co-A mutase-associated GTPase MeaB [Desulfatitalea sp.]NNK01757.1 methylmalonyl Co-A mutase-associated GTPase MeaB [Desulfatitalea sp.]
MKSFSGDKKTTVDIDNLLSGLRKGRIGPASRIISILEQGNADDMDRIMDEVFPQTGHGWVVGITGPPGAGKSSLINNLIREARQEDLKIGSILVDPTSPVSGGAVLGDRIRMSSFAADQKVFIRSMGSRGTLGGLSAATLGAVRVLDYLKYDYIFVETVGSGQVDINICDIADTVCLVLIPGAGDAIQAIKSGIREVNDIFVVNKRDRPGSEQVVSNIRNALEMREKHNLDDNGWQIPIHATDSLLREGISELWDSIKQHKKTIQKTVERQDKQRRLATQEVVDTIMHKFKKEFLNQIEEKIRADRTIDEIINRKKSPQKVGNEIFSKIVADQFSFLQMPEKEIIKSRNGGKRCSIKKP